uniref:Granzyme-like protein 1 n=1 Tax=Cyprinodon variegatus TaxID=28743 RepID=A0A3Q2D7Y5_CYPVA
IMHSLSTFLLFYILACLKIVHGADIIHGEKVRSDSMLYMVSVQNKWGHVCGGFLVSEDIVITAAHCKIDHVVLGTHNLRKWNISPLNITYMCKYPTYISAGFGDDLMILRLSGKAPLKKLVKTLPIPKDEIKLKEGEICSVAGWGKTESKDFIVDDMGVVNVSLLNPQLCRKIWGPGLPPKVICAGGYNTNKGFCQGDSGGPLVCKGMAVGVVSFNRHRNCKYPDVPNVYTDISKYLQWINKIIETKK